MLYAVVRFVKAGWHGYPGAKENRAYLRSLHRHLFHVEVKMQVFHEERDIEYHDLLDQCERAFPGGEMQEKSCETMAVSLARSLESWYPGRFLHVSVFEDGEVGALYESSGKSHLEGKVMKERQEVSGGNMFYTVSKRFSFSASHQLTNLPKEHPCSRLHGHNYEVELLLRKNTVDDRGFVVDYRDMEPFSAYLQETFDHRHVNDVLGESASTSENIAKHLYDVAWKLFHEVAITVRVSETPKTWAEYSKA